MLRKLLKYDLKNIYKYLIIFYILALFFAILTRIFSELNQTLFTTIIANVCMGTMIAMVVNILINTLIRNWVRLKETLYGDESYLTHTLPISKTTLIEEKYILSGINLFTSFIVIILSLFIAFYNKTNIAIIKEMITNLMPNINLSLFTIIFMFIVILFVELYNAYSCGFLGLILGNKKNNNKILYSIIIGFITYIISQTAMLVILFINALFDKNIMSIFKTNIIKDYSILKYLSIECIIIYVLSIVIINIFSKRAFKKGVNVE